MLLLVDLIDFAEPQVDRIVFNGGEYLTLILGCVDVAFLRLCLDRQIIRALQGHDLMVPDALDLVISIKYGWLEAELLADDGIIGLIVVDADLGKDIPDVVIAVP